MGWRAGGGVELTIGNRHTRAGVLLQIALGGDRGAVREAIPLRDRTERAALVAEVVAGRPLGHEDVGVLALHDLVDGNLHGEDGGHDRLLRVLARLRVPLHLTLAMECD